MRFFTTAMFTLIISLLPCRRWRTAFAVSALIDALFGMPALRHGYATARYAATTPLP